VLGAASKVIVDTAGGPGVLPYLPLQTQGARPSASPSGATQ
jgi:hypothetical protein